MASIITTTLSLTLFFSLILFARPSFSADSPASSPSPSSQPPSTPSPIASPPAPPPANSHSPAPSPRESDGGNKTVPAPAPAPVVVGDVGHSSADDSERKDESSGGMSGGKKAGIALGVIGAVAVVGIGSVVYKKRQQNIQRSQYGNAARREFL